MQFKNFIFINWKPDNTIKFYYVIKNLGAQPAKILEAKTFIHLDNSRATSNVTFRPNYELKKPSIIQYYVSREEDAVLTCESTEIIPKRDYDLINNKQASFCFFCKIKYVNTVTKKVSDYEFGVMFESFLGTYPQNEFEIIYQSFK